MRITRTTGALVAAAAALTLGLTACGTDGDDADATPTTMLSSESAPAATSMAPAAADLIGPGCAAYAEANPTGPASLAELAKQPVATAAGDVPMLTTLTAALSGGLNPEVNLVDTLDDGQFTVFAPVDTAFEKLDAATVDKLKTDSTLLTSILTYHVVSGQVAPADAVGTHTTVEGAELTVTAEGDEVKVNDATVVCGGIQTANAKVYLIDSVLTPPMS